MDVLHCRKQENLEKALYMALEAVAKGAEIIVFPEVFSTGFCYEDFDHAAENLPSPTLENLACFSEANDCVLIGSVIQKDIEENNLTTKENSFKEKANSFTEKEKRKFREVKTLRTLHSITISASVLSQEPLQALIEKLIPLRMKTSIFPGAIQ